MEKPLVTAKQAWLPASLHGGGSEGTRRALAYALSSIPESKTSGFPTALHMYSTPQTGPVQGLPHMAAREDRWHSSQNVCPWGGPETSPSAGTRYSPLALTYLLRPETICCLCVSVSGNPRVTELRSRFPL